MKKLKNSLGKRKIFPSPEFRVIEEVIEGTQSMGDRLELLKYEDNMLRSLVILDSVRYEILSKLAEETGLDPAYLYKLPYDQVLKIVISSLVETDRHFSEIVADSYLL